MDWHNASTLPIMWRGASPGTTDPELAVEAVRGGAVDDLDWVAPRGDNVLRLDGPLGLPHNDFFAHNLATMLASPAP
jgi:hypothetical protein